jgi:hypothetical protein
VQILEFGWEAFDGNADLAGTVDVLTMVIEHAVTTLFASSRCGGAGLLDELPESKIFLQSQFSVSPAGIK